MLVAIVNNMNNTVLLNDNMLFGNAIIQNVVAKYFSAYHNYLHHCHQRILCSHYTTVVYQCTLHFYNEIDQCHIQQVLLNKNIVKYSCDSKNTVGTQIHVKDDFHSFNFLKIILKMESFSYI